MFERLEQYLVPLVIAGALVALVGLFWLIRRGFKEGWGWGFAALIPPLQLLFWWQRPKAATAPWAVILVGAAISLGTIGAVQYANRIDLGERERVVDGKLHLTLTGWDRTDYSLLKSKPDVAVLQMANPDVTNATLGFIEYYDKLEELDISDSAITDDFFFAIAHLPKLRVLRIARTAISDGEFRRRFLTQETPLMEADVRGTQITSKTMREWKAAREGRKYLK